MRLLLPLATLFLLSALPIMTWTSAVFGSAHPMSLPVLAQVSESHPASPSLDGLPSWATGTGVVIGMLGGPVFAIWYAYYMTTIRIPAIEKAHADQISESRKVHAEYVLMLITNYRSDVESMWKTKREDDLRAEVARREDDNRMSQALDRLTDKLDDKDCKFTALR